MRATGVRRIRAGPEARVAVGGAREAIEGTTSGGEALRDRGRSGRRQLQCGKAGAGEEGVDDGVVLRRRDHAA